jgi:hypothetical protein
MRLTQAEANVVLQFPFFTAPTTESLVDYEFYRGHLNTSVFNVRFNTLPSLSQSFIDNFLIEKLFAMYALNSTVLASVSHDLLLKQPTTNSYYIWKANTNQRSFDEGSEIVLTLNANNIHRFASTITNFNPADLNIYFNNSNVIVEKILAYVCGFAPV